MEKQKYFSLKFAHCNSLEYINRWKYCCLLAVYEQNENNNNRNVKVKSVFSASNNSIQFYLYRQWCLCTSIYEIRLNFKYDSR